jgi:hypothetical protein
LRIALLAFLSVPAVAAEPSPRPTAGDLADAQKVLRDPQTGEAVARMTGALTRAIMNAPVGEFEAAIEGRPATRADRQRTVRDRIGGPVAAARIEREVAASGVRVQAMGNALADALPGMLAAAGDLQRELEKAVANLPDPTYPRR